MRVYNKIVNDDVMRVELTFGKEDMLLEFKNYPQTESIGQFKISDIVSNIESDDLNFAMRMFKNRKGSDKVRNGIFGYGEGVVDALDLCKDIAIDLEYYESSAVLRDAIKSEENLPNL